MWPSCNGCSERRCATIARGAIEGGLLAYAAYDVGKTAVEVKADLDAGRLDAAASKVGGMTGTIIGGVGPMFFMRYSFGY